MCYTMFLFKILMDLSVEKRHFLVKGEGLISPNQTTITDILKCCLDSRVQTVSKPRVFDCAHIECHSPYISNAHFVLKGPK